VLFDTSFGRVWCWRLLFSFLLIGACLAPLARRRMPAILVLSLLLLVSPGWVGHAVEGQGVTSLVHQFNQMVHLLAAGLWLGGLVPLTWLLARAAVPIWRGLDFGRARRGAAVLADGIRRGGAPCRDRRDQHAAAGRQRRSAGWHALRPAAGSEDPVVFGDGRSGADQSLPPAAAPSPRTAVIGSDRGARSVLFEQALGFAVLTVVSVLGTWPPAIHHHGG